MKMREIYLSRPIKESLIYNLVFKILVVVLLALLFCLFVVNYIVSDEMSNNLTQNTLLNFSKINSQIHVMFKNGEDKTHVLYSAEELRDYLSRDNKGTLSEIQNEIALKKRLELIKMNEFDLIIIAVEGNNNIISSPNEFILVKGEEKNEQLLKLLNFDSIKAHRMGQVNLSGILARESKIKNYIYTKTQFQFIHNNENYNYEIILGLGEDKLQETYSHMLNENNDIFIVDNNGEILSTSDKNLLGSRINYEDHDISNLEEFDYIIDNKKYRVIPYKVDIFGWYIINQIPIEEYMQEINKKLIMVKGTFLLCFIVISILLIRLIIRGLKPFYALKTTINEIAEGNLSCRFGCMSGVAELDLLGVEINNMADNLIIQIDKEKEYIKQQNNLQLKVLLAQINPHFIHNTLNMIKWMSVLGGTDNITGATQSLINILAPGFKNKSLTWTLEKEKDFLREYFNILDIRFCGDLMISLNMDDSLYSHEVPRYIVQPLVENSITHGYSHGEKLHVNVDIIKGKKYIEIKVEDDGVGMDETSFTQLESMVFHRQSREGIKKGNSIGIKNIYERLELLYSEEYSLKFLNDIESGFKVIISIPIKSLS